MPKSFLVKKKKARWSEEGGGEDAKLAGHETPDETRTLPEELKLEQEKLISEEEEDEEGETERLLSADREPEMADSPCKQNETEDMCVDEKETKQDSYYKHDSPVQPSNSCEEFCWWTSISTRYELQKLPPPPKLISSVPRNGLAKMHHSTERQPVITLSQSHHFPLPGNGFGVVSFSDHRVPPVPESIPLRASLDGLREVSLNLRHPSDGHCESSALCGNVPQAIATPPPQLNGNHFFIHSHPFLTSHRQQECGIPTLQHKQSQNRKPGLEGDDTKYKCEICNSSFTLQRLLNRHMKTHSFYKRYHCQFCTKGFNDTFDLKRHIRTHTGIKPFKCSRCDKSFTQRCSLEAHLTRVHGILHKFGFRERRSKMFVCEDCGRTFTENSDFMKHLHELHPETEKIMRARRNGGFAPKMKDVS